MRTNGNGLTERQRRIIAQERARGATPGLIAADHRLDEAAVKELLDSAEGRERVGEQGGQRQGVAPAPQPFARRIARLRAHNASSRMVVARKDEADAKAWLPLVESTLRQAQRTLEATAEAGEQPEVRVAAAMLVDEAAAEVDRRRDAARAAEKRRIETEAEWKARKREAQAAGARAVEPAL